MKHYRIITPIVAAIMLTGCAAEAPLPDRSDVQTQIRALEQERSDLLQQIADLGIALTPDPVCILCFDGAYPSLLETAFPILESSGYPATVIVTTDTLPGKEGMMIADQAKELLTAGWEFVPSVTAEPLLADGVLNPAWIAELDQILADLRDLELPTPSSYAFAPDSYNPLADQALADRGLTAVLHRWSNSKIETEKLDEYQMELYGGAISDGNPVYRIGGATICAGTSTAQRNVQNACDQKTVIAVCTGQVKRSVPAADQNIDCTVNKFKMMLEDVAEYGDQWGLRVLTFSETCRYKRKFEADLDRQQADYDDFCQQARARIDEIEQEISALMKQALKG